MRIMMAMIGTCAEPQWLGGQGEANSKVWAMRRGRGCAWLAMLVLASTAAMAQGPSESGNPASSPLRVRDLPPEVRAQLPPDLPSDTILVGPPQSDGAPAFGDPVALEPLELLEQVPAEVDAVVAREIMQLLPVHFMLVDPLISGAPFNADFPTGTDVRQVVQDGRLRHCLRQQGVFTPLEDEDGEIYPGLCLEDRDQDGAFETALFLPYLSGLPERTMAVEPVRLEPNPAGSAADRDALTACRQIRVAAVDTRGVRLVLEHQVVPSASPDPHRFYSGADESVDLPLRVGATTELGGITVRAELDSGRWRLIPVGRFGQWLRVYGVGERIVAGTLEYSR